MKLGLQVALTCWTALLKLCWAVYFDQNDKNCICIINKKINKNKIISIITIKNIKKLTANNFK